MRVTMPLHGLPEELQFGFSIPTPGHKGFQDLAVVVDGTPEVKRHTVDLHEYLVQVPAPMA